jgi:hypothetical protein
MKTDASVSSYYMNNSISTFEDSENPTVIPVMASSGTFVMGHDVRQLEQ